MTQSFARTATCYEASSFNDTPPAVEHYQSVEPDNAQVRLRLLPDSLQPSSIHNPIFLSEPSSPPRSSPALWDSSSSLSSTAIVPYESRASPSALSSPTSQPCNFCGALFDNAASLCTHIVLHHCPSKPFYCGRGTCVTHGSKRSLERHLTNTHFYALYICCYGTSNRKDKHCEHLRKCACVGNVYRCICGHTEDNKHAHKVHIDECGKRKKGRPKKQKTDSG
ncbi:hypothetical protein FVEG_01531 [Fusarium verticillioides 7600]|uniref:C2H2-type domain-containing protein n=1 Tax=Gibberella moniliformis (strain M3125 / FGSC 7600) TaxID=334819 RepID=W7M027_GIBM7|nr:hypothetical protein FVEG_01531 [Fusarium verticillioides 7600]EWG38272.1 hypothetical protein FVEG_01531 [Fusarium verticillioides 7600]